MTASPARPAPVRVLVADDQDDIRMLIRMAFRTDPRFEVVGEAANGAEAVRQAANLQPDLIVLDRQMPVLDGLEALPAIRRSCPGATVVMFTAFADDEVRRMALGLGADEVLTKVDVKMSTFARRLSSAVTERAATGAENLAITVGPMPSAIARVWIPNTIAIVAATKANLEDLAVDVEPDILDRFLGYLREWDSIAKSNETFFWAATADLETARQLIETWARIDAIPEGELRRLGCSWSPPEGRPFFEALSTAVIDALQHHEATVELAERLHSQFGVDQLGGS